MLDGLLGVPLMLVRNAFLALLPALLMALPADAVISAPEGNRFAYLSTGPGGNGGGDTGGDLDGDEENEWDLAALILRFSIGAADTLSFEWDLLTEEVSGGVSDFFRVVLDGGVILSGSVLTPGDTALPPPGVGPFMDGGILGPDFSEFGDGRLGFRSYSGPISAGSHTLAFEVYDDSDDVVDTALLVDALALGGLVFEGFESDSIGAAPDSSNVFGVMGNVTVEGFDSFEQFESVPEPGTPWLLGLAALGLAGRRRR